MKILLAPSESKTFGGSGKLDLNSLIFNNLTPKREELIDSYQAILNQANLEELKELFGLKKEEEIKKYIVDIYKEPVKKAIKRYSGVAFDYLDYNSLDNKAKEYVDSNLLIFSNLFGVLRASDLIPLYRLKQGASINGVKVENFYNPILKEPLDDYLRDEDILDLRAKYYEKFYKPTKSYTTLKFLKNKKVVSHWAKAYRGMVLRECAINKVSSIEEFLKIDFPNLQIIEIIEKKSYKEIIYSIID